MRRLIVVYNPRATNFKKVRVEVLERLKDFKGFLVGKYEVLPTNFEDNVNHLAKILVAKDLVIAVGGDATAAIAVNSILKTGFTGNDRPTLAVLPYGNFNDLARTLGFKKIEDVFTNAGVVDFWPLEVMVDGEHFRYSSCYVTMGMMAEATEIFDQPKVREKLRKSRRRHLYSYYYLAKWYFKNHKKEFLPKFELNGVLVKATDYIAANGKSMARVMKTRESYSKNDFFYSNMFSLSFFGKLFDFMFRSMIFFTPVKKTFGDILTFKNPADIEIQIEGEYKKFVQVKQVVVKKSVQPIKVMVR